jgi:hypothetical protein
VKHSEPDTGTLPLFDVGEYTIELPDGLVAKLPATQLARIKAGVHPATGLSLRGEGTCGECAHAVQVGHNTRTYWKCDLVRITRGAGTDIRLKWPACEKFEAKP